MPLHFVAWDAKLVLPIHVAALVHPKRHITRITPIVAMFFAIIPSYPYLIPLTLQKFYIILFFIPLKPHIWRTQSPGQDGGAFPPKLRFVSSNPKVRTMGYWVWALNLVVLIDILHILGGLPPCNCDYK